MKLNKGFKVLEWIKLINKYATYIQIGLETLNFIADKLKSNVESDKGHIQA